jgi:predicted dithiol-disulfide oxidoreductase (DUF899 family)
VADHSDGALPHLNARDVTLVCASCAPLEHPLAYKTRMRWRFPWVSSLHSDFSFDFAAAFTEQQQRDGADCNFRHVDKPAPQREGLSAFAIDGGVVHHTCSTSRIRSCSSPDSVGAFTPRSVRMTRRYAMVRMLVMA